MTSLEATPEIKRLAQQAVTQAVRDGRLVRRPCESHNCPHPLSGVVAHHDDYRFPLKVRWLCRSHHVTFHCEQERMEDSRKHASQRPPSGQPEDGNLHVGGLPHAGDSLAGGTPPDTGAPVVLQCGPNPAPHALPQPRTPYLLCILAGVSLAAKRVNSKQ